MHIRYMISKKVKRRIVIENHSTFTRGFPTTRHMLDMVGRCHPGWMLGGCCEAAKTVKTAQAAKG